MHRHTQQKSKEEPKKNERTKYKNIQTEENDDKKEDIVKQANMK